MTSRSRRREEVGIFFYSSALEIFALNGVALKSESKRPMLAWISHMLVTLGFYAASLFDQPIEFAAAQQTIGYGVSAVNERGNVGHVRPSIARGWNIRDGLKGIPAR